MKVRLIPLFKSSKEKAIVVRGPRFVIGRADGCDLRLRSSIVSRHHCELIVQGDEVHICDLGSSNGTFVNQEPVFGEACLKNGDVLGVATNIYRVEVCVPGSGLRLLSRFGHAVVNVMN